MMGNVEKLSAETNTNADLWPSAVTADFEAFRQQKPATKIFRIAEKPVFDWEIWALADNVLEPKSARFH